MPNQYRSVFDIIGPIMIGPSSSHTAGAVAIGHVANRLFHTSISKIIVRYYESFAQTHQGHGTDYAIISGVLGFDPADKRVPMAVDLARRQGIDVVFIEEPGKSPVNHPNTAELTLINREKELTIWGCSIGGGTIEIRQVDFNGIKIKTDGPLPLIFVESEQAIGTALDRIFGENYRDKRISVKVPDRFLYKIELIDKPYPEQIEQVRGMSQDVIVL
ncbi:L-serine ammonia-lyase, iron-sulfur-dependent subunit beta [Latilactobacillus graminis]|uniref:L-serine dehydratase n=2 Tax=Latilactobacillus graminis TaxID=60519 RepID=A0AA89KYR5_9LACO|nr:L-serine ammonia-lyase, iron-sulfur-dependent subunit beta [Latilactobacillus graminis]KRM24574.1 L-serine dehydratase, iron-sulfur-dependent, beta subunit [Latilactobacillus graminis DSM 20719]QFP78974.1 L-serine ammonia-lyase, iron-sulfur-dependent, subunit beta [Latilactobacillus graminis]